MSAICKNGLFSDYVTIIFGLFFAPKQGQKDYIRVMKRLCADYLCNEKMPVPLQCQNKRSITFKNRSKMEKLSNNEMNLLRGGTSQPNSSESSESSGYVYIYIGGGAWVRISKQR